ncbi:TPA: relaxase/mobilization nuclease domain-containing protein [Acinetobacter baumannii]|nr:relaxase/mobilization nuclease domain-containing protein [Acinetobacter baumannii]
MIVKIFKYGKGKSKHCLDYLLGKDRDREHARVLSGDVDLTAAIIDSSRFTKKYTAGCLSFAEADLPESAKEKIMADYEHCLFPGMNRDQYDILWIEHRDKGRLELNFVIPNVELSTGKRLQPFYAPADLGRVDCFKKIVNHEYQLHDPDDPENKQASTVKMTLDEEGNLEYDEQGNPKLEPKYNAVGKSKTANELVQEIDAAVMTAYLKGNIKNRNETILYLVDKLNLDVTRITNKGISISLPDRKRPIRLKGELYERGFEVNPRDPSAESERTERVRAALSDRISEVYREYESRIETKANSFAERYRSIEQTHSAESRFVATTTYRADQSIQQLYSTVFNEISDSAWNIDSSFTGISFDSIYLEWFKTKSDYEKRRSLETAAAAARTESLPVTREISNADRSKIISTVAETIDFYRGMSSNNDIAKSYDRELAAQSERTRKSAGFSEAATARAISDANASYERFRRNLSFGNTDAAALRKVFESEELKQQPKPEPVVIHSPEKTTEPQKKAENTQTYDGPDGP